MKKSAYVFFALCWLPIVLLILNTCIFPFCTETYYMRESAVDTAIVRTETYLKETYPQREFSIEDIRYSYHPQLYYVTVSENGVEHDVYVPRPSDAERIISDNIS